MYCGLNNLGNTCYMNSLLQTLFMTRPFREALFRWKYDSNKHPNQEDCIPYQLQLLFAKMQEGNLEATDARGLIKSFQWDAQESFAQHDVQEFCRVLFDAIQQSCSEDEEFINYLYQSQSQSYVNCLECTYQSLRNDSFLDLSLTVKSDFDGVYNESLEKAIKYFLKPEKLDGGNKYSCSGCNKKVEATKGLRLLQLSEILTIQLNRFELNLNTFERQKVNDYVSYPFVLDMNNFLKQYDDIVVLDDVQLLHERSELKQQQQDDPARGRASATQGKKTLGNRLPSPGEPVRKQVQFNEFQNVVIPVPPPIKQMQNAVLKEAQQQLDEKWKNIDIKVKDVQEHQKVALIQTADEAYDLDNDVLFGTGFDLGDLGEGTPANQIKSKEVKASVKATEFEDAEDTLYKQVQEESHNLQLQEDIKKALLNGPNVYELYSVMVHSGGALGGHYYSYIKSFENQQWYCFNDSSVSKISHSQILSVFGDKFPKHNSGTSAYFLMYRKSNTAASIEKPKLPDDLIINLKKELVLIAKQEKQKIIERYERDMMMTVKCFYKDRDTLIKARRDWKLSTLKEFIVADLDVKEEDENTRIRFYNQNEKIALDTFTNRDDQTLQELCFTDFKSVILETKAAHEKFIDYDPNIITFKIFMYNPDITMDRAPQLKIQIHNQSTIDDLQEQIQQRTGVAKDNQVLIRRQILGTAKLSEQIAAESDTKLKDLYIGQLLNLYVEERTDIIKWDQVFESETFRCHVVFNDPRTVGKYDVPDYCYQLPFDSRKTLQLLKEAIADFLGIDADTFIMKRGSKHSQELKDLTLPLRENGILGRGTLYLSMGTPSAKQTYHIKIQQAVLSDVVTDNIDYIYSDLFRLDVSLETTILGLKTNIGEKIGVEPSLIRLRHKINQKLGQVYHDDYKLAHYRIFDDQVFVVEVLQTTDTIPENAVLLYVKFYDMENFKLSHPPLELFIQQHSTLDDLSVVLESKCNIQRDAMEAIKILNIYSFCITDLVIASFDWTLLKYNTNCINKAPWFVCRDSSLIIIRDARKVPNDMFSLRQKCEELQQQDKSNKYTTISVGTAPPIAKPKEKALKITVVKKADQEAPKQQVDEGQTGEQDSTKQEDKQ